jgi:hypothetical protein
MTVPGSAHALLLAGAVDEGGYAIERSLRTKAAIALPEKSELEKKLNYDPTAGVFTWKKTKGVAEGKEAGCVNCKGYIVIRFKNRLWLAQRLAWRMHYGDDPGAAQVDHINRVRTDNAIKNLRLAEPGENNFNMSIRSDNKSGLKGVHFRRDINRWAAKIKHQNTNHCLGCFDTKEQAATVYDAKAVELFGEYALTNAQLQEVAA